MGKSGRLRLGDVRAALRLVGECRDVGYDPRLWGRHLIGGLCRLIGARMGDGGEVHPTRPLGPIDGATCFHSGFEPREQAVYEAFLRAHGISRHPLAIWYDKLRRAGTHLGQMSVLTRRQLIPNRDWYESVAYQEHLRVIGTDNLIGSRLESTAEGWRTFIILHRTAGEPDFTPRQQALLALVHKELARLIGPVLVSAGDPYSPTRLAPRVQETLRCLLDGDGEKQAAARMGLSRETVHQYVKALYRHYRVASRAELLARVLRRTYPGG
jgi:DNA-binding CsgD family transcriptional regulator